MANFILLCLCTVMSCWTAFALESAPVCEQFQPDVTGPLCPKRRNQTAISHNKQKWAELTLACVKMRCASPVCETDETNSYASVLSRTATGVVEQSTTVFASLDGGGLKIILPGKEAQVDIEKNLSGEVAVTAAPQLEEQWELNPDCSGRFLKGKYTLKVTATYNVTATVNFKGHAGYQVGLFRAGVNVGTRLSAKVSAASDEIRGSGPPPVIEFAGKTTEEINEEFEQKAKPYLEATKQIIRKSLEDNLSDEADGLEVGVLAPVQGTLEWIFSPIIAFNDWYIEVHKDCDYSYGWGF